MCILGSFAVLWLFGFSINLLTLLALVLSIGIVVDDAIVVLENVHHRIEEGEPPLAAAYHGTKQVGFAVLSTTLVVCAVFVPIMFIAGQTGLLFRELAVAMVGAVAFSGFFALSLAPMLCSKLMRHENRGRLAAWVDRRFRALEDFYARRLDGMLKKPLIPIVVVLLFIGASGGLFFTLQSELVPAEDTGIVQVNVNAPEGTGFAEMTRYMERGAGAAAADDRRERPGAHHRHPRARRLRRQRRFQQRRRRRSSCARGRSGPRRPQSVVGDVNRAHRPGRGGARQRLGAQLAEPRPRQSGQFRHRRRDLSGAGRGARPHPRRGAGQSRPRQRRQRL